MPRGFGGVRQASAELEAKRAASSGPGAGALWFRLNAGAEANVRFLEQDDDIIWSNVVEVPVEGRSWGRDVPVGTAAENPELWEFIGDKQIKTKFKGWINLIWFDAPVFKRDENKRIVRDQMKDPVIIGQKDQVAIWSSGMRLFENLDEINANFKGLMSRRFKIKRKGEGLNTTYSINPVDVDSGPQPMSDAEKALAESKYDLNEFVQVPTVEDLERQLQGLPSGAQPSFTGNGGGSNNEPQAARVNPFMRNR